jgi:hypothetical protein
MGRNIEVQSMQRSPAVAHQEVRKTMRVQIGPFVIDGAPSYANFQEPVELNVAKYDRH